MEEFKNFVIETIKNYRKTKSSINFIQLGAYDGVSFNDMANLITQPQDKGVFVEPNEIIFEVLKENKKEFINSIFLKSAIIPDETFDHSYFYIDLYGGQSTFVKNVFNEKIHKSSNVDTLNVDDFLKKYVDFEIEILFSDCEGYDHDIIKKLLRTQNPKFIYFESWNTINLNNQLQNNVFTTREEILEILKNYNYQIKFEPIEENIFAFK